MPLLAGLLSGLPVGVLSGSVLWLRGGFYVPQLAATGEDMSAWDEHTLRGLLAAGGVLAGIGIGLLARIIYGQMSVRLVQSASPYFLTLALGPGTIASIFAVSSKGPMRGEKIALNIFFSLGLGLLIPFLVG